jgi:hypothetical protein
VGQLAAFLAKIFSSKKEKGPCCGIELEEIDVMSAAPVSAVKDPCAGTTSAKPQRVQPRALT